MNLEEQVVVLGVDDMGFGLNGSEGIRTLTVVEEGKGKGRAVCLGLAPRCGLVSRSSLYYQPWGGASAVR